MTLERFEPRWTRLLGMDLEVGGRFDGTLTLDRDAGGAVDFVGAVGHLSSAGDFSRFAGAGRLDLDGSGVDAALDVNPLSLSLLRPWASGVELAGSVTGPVRVSGVREALVIDASLDSDLGGITLDGEFDLASEELRYDARIEGTDLSLNEWIEGAPESRLAIRGRVAGAGVDPATLEADFDFDILSSAVDQAQIFDSRVRFDIADGVAMIDSLYLASDVGTLLARGSLGLTEGREGRLDFEADAADLSDWDRWFVEEIPGAAASEAGEPLFDSTEAVLGGPGSGAPTEGLEGRLTARGRVTGRWGDLKVAADIEATGARFRRYQADHIQARVEQFDPIGMDAFVARLTATGAELNGRPLDSLFVRLDRTKPGPRSRGGRPSHGRRLLRAAGFEHRSLRPRRCDQRGRVERRSLRVPPPPRQARVAVGPARPPRVLRFRARHRRPVDRGPARTPARQRSDPRRRGGGTRA